MTDVTDTDFPPYTAHRNVRGPDKSPRGPHRPVFHTSKWSGVNWAWHERARCAEMDDSFFADPPQFHGRMPKALREYYERVCISCPVLALCHEQAVDTRASGVWMAGRMWGQGHPVDE